MSWCPHCHVNPLVEDPERSDADWVYCSVCPARVRRCEECHDRVAALVFIGRSFCSSCEKKVKAKYKADRKLARIRKARAKASEVAPRYEMSGPTRLLAISMMFKSYESRWPGRRVYLSPRDLPAGVDPEGLLPEDDPVPTVNIVHSWSDHYVRAPNDWATDPILGPAAVLEEDQIASSKQRTYPMDMELDRTWPERCVRGHDLTGPDSLYKSPMGYHQCRRCQAIWRLARRVKLALQGTSAELSSEEVERLKDGLAEIM